MHGMRSWAIQRLHCSSRAVRLQAGLFTSMGLRFFHQMEEFCNSYLEGLEVQNHLRERGRVLKGTSVVPMGWGV